MEVRIIKENYEYIEFCSDIDMFSYLSDCIKNGYNIIRGKNLCVEIYNGNTYKLLSYKHFDNIDDIFNNEYKCDIVYPNYNNTFLNTIGAIRENYGYDFKYKSNCNIFDKYYKKVVVLILDGLGLNVLNLLNENSFLRSIYKYHQHSIYPSTTAAATTSIKSGMSPYSSGWTGWENYISEINRDIVLFRGTNYYTDEYTGVSGYMCMPYNMFYSDMDIKGYVVEPNFSTNHKIDDVLKESIKINKKNEKQIQYVYYTEPDAALHEYGVDSKEVLNVLKNIDLKVRNYAQKLSEDTILIITADHGHTDVSEINLYACDILIDLLERKPANDARCIAFKVKKDKFEEFEFVFNSLFSSIYKLYKSEDAIKLGFFGCLDDIRHQRIDDFLGDYVAVGIGDYYFNYKGKGEFVFKSHHAGITRNEMIVPICVFKR